MSDQSSSEPRSLLLLGGTSWLGGAVAALAASRGHRVTCLARGESGRVPEGVRHVVADRWLPAAYDEVAGQSWDAVLEVSWQPDLVRGAVEALGDWAAHWLYVSSGSVYTDDATPDQDESAPLHDPWTGSGRVDIESYGPAKVACERAVLERVGAQRAFVCRPGLIAGYGDPSDRFGYWPGRFARPASGDAAVLCPPAGSPVQVIDVLDLARWLVGGVEQGVTGVYDAVGDRTTLGEVLAACAAATGRRPRLAEADDDWLVAQGVEPWSGPESLPLWLPLPDYAGFMTRRNGAATAAGLRLRPIRDTVADALRWETEQGLDRPRRSGLTVAREADLVAALDGGA